MFLERFNMYRYYLFLNWSMQFKGKSQWEYSPLHLVNTLEQQSLSLASQDGDAVKDRDM